MIGFYFNSQNTLITTLSRSFFMRSDHLSVMNPGYNTFNKRPNLVKDFIFYKANVGYDT